MAHPLKTSPINQPPPQGGAIDLSALKTAPPEAIEGAWREQLLKMGLVCPCGARIHDRESPWTVFMRRENTISSNVGGLPGLVGVQVHDLNCIAFLDIYNNPDFEIVALGQKTEIVWFDEINEEALANIQTAAAAREAALESAKAEQEAEEVTAA